MTLMLCLHPAGATAASLPPVVIGSPTGGWPPFMLSDNNPTGPGFMLEVFIKAAAALNRNVQIKQLPDDQALDMLRQGHIDVYAKARKWVSSPADFQWSAPVIYSTDVLVMRADDERIVHAPEDIAGLRVGAVQGYHYPKLEPLFASGTIQRLDTEDSAKQMRLLLRGGTDVAVVNNHVAAWLASHSPGLSPKCFRFADVPLDSAAYRYVYTLARAWGPFIRNVDKEIEAMRKDGRMEAILARYR